MLREHGDADARLHLEVEPIELKWRFECGDDRFSDPVGLVCSDVGKHDGELIAAETSDHPTLWKH